MSFTDNPVVNVIHADIIHEEQVILQDISFKIGKGEFVYIVGRTGSGKTSILKTLYADLPLHNGEVYVSDFKVHQLKKSEIPYLRRKLGIVFQDFQLLPDRSIAENLKFVLNATGTTDKAKIKARIAEVLMRVGLGSVDSKMPHQLSGGEQQRVVIARALLNEPTLLIADEPTGNLDPEIGEGILDLFMEINKSGTAILMATHDYHIIKNYPNRILKCDHQKLLDSNQDKIELTGVVY